MAIVMTTYIFFLTAAAVVVVSFFVSLVLLAECVCLSSLFLSLFYTPRVACEPADCEKLRILLCVSLLDFCFFPVLFSLASLPDLNFFFSLQFLICYCFDFGFDFWTYLELLFPSCPFCVGSSAWSFLFLWRLVQRTACI